MHIHNICNGTWTQTRQLSETQDYTIWLYIGGATYVGGHCLKSFSGKCGKDDMAIV